MKVRKMTSKLKIKTKPCPEGLPHSIPQSPKTSENIKNGLGY